MKDPRKHRLWRSVKTIIYWLENILRLLLIPPKIRRQIAPGVYEDLP